MLRGVGDPAPMLGTKGTCPINPEMVDGQKTEALHLISLPPMPETGERAGLGVIKQESCPYPSPMAALWRVAPIAHLGNTTQLILMAYA